MACPKITVVTPSFNQGKFLYETIESVLNQDYPNLEYFIVDGGSTDDSISIIHEYEKRIDWWVSEADKGQSDALNKGFAKATGDFLVWVNSDDVLLPSALKTVGEFINRNPGVKWISGNSIWIDTDGKVIHCANMPKCNRFISGMGLLVVGGPSTFFSRDLYEEVGSFREELYFTMDVDMWWRFYKAGVCFKHIPEYFMAFRFHSESKCSSASFKFVSPEEKQRIRLKGQQKIDESKMIVRKYGNKYLLPIARYLHRARQLLNCNYFNAWRDLKKMGGKDYRSIFPFYGN